MRFSYRVLYRPRVEESQIRKSPLSLCRRATPRPPRVATLWSAVDGCAPLPPLPTPPNVSALGQQARTRMASTEPGPPRPAPAPQAVLRHARLLLQWRAAAAQPSACDKALEAIVAGIVADAGAALTAGVADVIADAATTNRAHAEAMVRALGAPHWPQVRTALERKGTPADLIFSLVAASMPREPPAPTYSDLDDAVSQGHDASGRTLTDLARAALNALSGHSAASEEATAALTSAAMGAVVELMVRGDRDPADRLAPVQGLAAARDPYGESVIEQCFAAW